MLVQTVNIGGAKNTTWFEYDAAGRLMELVYPDGYVLTHQYDGVDRVKSLGSFGNFTYTKDDKIKTLTSGNGILTTYSYDSRARPTRVLIKDGSTTLQDLNYTYSGNGNVLNIGSESYSYDGLDRLTSSTGPWGTIDYTYDGVGNRLTKTEGSTTNYSYGTYNRLSSSGAASYTYDNNGNTITKTNGTESWTYTYDYNNMMIRATNGSVTKGQYFYDGDGKRVKAVQGIIYERK